MAKRGPTPEQIIQKLREVEVAVACSTFRKHGVCGKGDGEASCALGEEGSGTPAAEGHREGGSTAAVHG